MNIAETQQVLDRVKALATHIEILEGRVHQLELEAAQRRGPGADVSRETLSLNKNRSVNGTR